MKKLVLGIIIGFILSIASTIYAEPVSQYVLTKVSYSIIVGGQELKDNDLPALNYKGNTYVPLRSVGDLLATSVVWNNELKRVEIGNENKPAPDNPSAANPVTDKPAQGNPTTTDPIANKPEQKPEQITLDSSYASFKNVFSSVNKRLDSDNKIWASAEQKTIDPKVFLDWWNGLGDQRKIYMENYTIEIQKLNPSHPIRIVYAYLGKVPTALGNVEVDANGAVWYSFVSDQVKNLEPDQSSIH